MHKHTKNMPPLLRKWYASRLAVVLESVLIGCIAGFVIVLFRQLLSAGDELRRALLARYPGSLPRRKADTRLE